MKKKKVNKILISSGLIPRRLRRNNLGDIIMPIEI